MIIFAAASTSELVNEWGRAYSASREATNVLSSLASSATLARQIEAGAECDIFISAEPRWIDELEQKQLVQPGTRQVLMGNDLVLIAPHGRRVEVKLERDAVVPAGLEGRWAIGDPAFVPAGHYARQALEHLGWWDQVRERIVPTADVRQALRLVERGEAVAGIVYASDLAVSDVELLGTFNSGLHDPIRYEVCAVRTGRSGEAASFLEFLRSPAAAAMIQKHGFRPPSEPQSLPSTRSGR